MMRKSHLVLLLIVSLTCFCFSSRADVQNGNFQSWTNGNPDNWNCGVWAGTESNTWSSDQTNYQWTGNTALKITHVNTNTYTVVYQTITVDPHSYYTVSCDAKVANIVPSSNSSGRARLYLDNGGGYTEINHTSWKKASISFYSGDRTSYVLYCYLNQASGTAWFDNVILTKVGLNNPHFELKNANNTPQDWSSFIMYTSETGTHTCDSNITWQGSYSLRIRHALSDTYTAVNQSYTVEPYTWYKVSCMAKTKCQKKDQYSGGARLYISSSGNSKYINIPDNQPIWQKASVDVYSGSNTSMTVYPYLHKASGTVWFDNIKIEPISYKNPYFEIDDGNGLPLNWSIKPWGTTGTASLDSTEKYEGSYSAKITNSSAAQYTYISQKIPVERDTYYKINCWGKVQNITTNAASVYFANFDRMYFNSTSWTEGEYNIFSSDNEMLEAFPMLNLSTGTFWVDEISVEKEAHPASLQLDISINLSDYVDSSTKRNLKVDGNNFFPIGFFHTRTISQLEEIAVAGFNMAIVSDQDVSTTYLDRASQLGVKVIIIIWNAHILSEIDDTVGDYKNHAAVIGWYYYDEPVYQRKTPAEMFEKYERIKENDTSNFVTSCFYQGKAFQYHQHCVDVAQDDNYFITSNSSDLGRIQGDTLKGKYSIMYDTNKTHFKTLQAYNYSGKVMPTYAQFRAQTFLAITGDAKGVMYWVYDDCNGSQTIKEAYPTLWNQLGGMNDEIDDVRSIIQEKTVQINKKGNICYILKENDAGNKQWLIAVNASSSSVSLSIEMGTTSKTISSIIPSSGTFTYSSSTHILIDSLSGYDVRVYEIQASSPTYGGEGSVWF
jgi:hypothetical protein